MVLLDGATEIGDRSAQDFEHPVHRVLEFDGRRPPDERRVIPDVADEHRCDAAARHPDRSPDGRLREGTTGGFASLEHKLGLGTDREPLAVADFDLDVGHHAAPVDPGAVPAHVPGEAPSVGRVPDHAVAPRNGRVGDEQKARRWRTGLVVTPDLDLIVEDVALLSGRALAPDERTHAACFAGRRSDVTWTSGREGGSHAVRMQPTVDAREPLTKVAARGRAGFGRDSRSPRDAHPSAPGSPASRRRQ